MLLTGHQPAEGWEKLLGLEMEKTLCPCDSLSNPTATNTLVFISPQGPGPAGTPARRHTMDPMPTQSLR